MRRCWWTFTLIVVLALLGTTGEARGQSFTQWAITVTASSEYGGGDWAAKQMLGEPDFYPNYGDDGHAWAPIGQSAGLQWVELGFEEAVYVERVDIYESFNPGSIVKVELIDTTGRWRDLGRNRGLQETLPGCSVSERHRCSTLPKVRITLDTDSVDGWNEIDAVSITGAEPRLGLRTQTIGHSSSMGKRSRSQQPVPP